MKSVPSADGARIHCEESGSGVPVLFVHEYGGSCRSFDAQVAAFRGRHRCVVFNARGYPPSEVPASADAYSQEHAVADIAGVMDGLAIERAHLVGVSMGAASSLQYALKEPGRVLSATLVGIGSGSDDPETFRAAAQATAKLLAERGMAALAAQMNDSPFGLTAAVWTRDERAAVRLGEGLQTGTFFQNRCDYLDPALAWTGVKNSGRGCTLSRIGYEQLTRPKSYHLRITT